VWMETAAPSAAPFTVSSPLLMSADRVLSLDVSKLPGTGGGTVPTITPGAGIYAVNVYNANGTVSVAPVLSLDGDQPVHGSLCQPPRAYVGTGGFYVCARVVSPVSAQEYRWRMVSWDALP
jgi:hypothetical protein